MSPISELLADGEDGGGGDNEEWIDVGDKRWMKKNRQKQLRMEQG